MTWGDRLERGVVVCPVWDELQSERMRFNVRTRYRAHWGSDPLLVFHMAQAIRRIRPQGSDPVERLPAVEGSWAGDHRGRARGDESGNGRYFWVRLIFLSAIHSARFALQYRKWMVLRPR